MIKNERIVRSDGRYELIIDNTNTLVCRSLIRESDKTSLSKSELKDLEDTQIVQVLSRSEIDSVWLHRSVCVAYCTDGRVEILKGFYDKAPDYKLSLGDSSPPELKFTRNSNGAANYVDIEDENELADSPGISFDPNMEISYEEER